VRWPNGPGSRKYSRCSSCVRCCSASWSPSRSCWRWVSLLAARARIAARRRPSRLARQIGHDRGDRSPTWRRSHGIFPISSLLGDRCPGAPHERGAVGGIRPPSRRNGAICAFAVSVWRRPASLAPSYPGPRRASRSRAPSLVERVRFSWSCAGPARAHCRRQGARRPRSSVPARPSPEGLRGALFAHPRDFRASSPAAASLPRLQA
jgi:hypothetical protein